MAQLECELLGITGNVRDVTVGGVCGKAGHEGVLQRAGGMQASQGSPQRAALDQGTLSRRYGAHP